MRRAYIYCLLLWAVILYGHLPMFAQQGDTLPEVTISHLRGIIGVNQITVFDSAQKARSAGMNMADMINASGQAYIKQYGPGNIATANLRGGSSYHTALLWNGLNLSNPMLGNTDLSLFPSIFTDINEIQYGGSGSLWGSGSVAGSFRLENTATFSPRFKVMAGTDYSSLHVFSAYGKLEAATKKTMGSVRFFTQQGKNDFSFNNPYTQTESRLTHAATRQYAAFGESAVRINNKNIIHVISFINRSDRMIAPLLTETTSAANQVDETLRGLMYWKSYFSSSMLMLRTGIIADRIIYSDSLKNLDEKSQSMLIPVELEWKKYVGKNNALLLYAGYRPVQAQYPWQEEKITQQNYSVLSKWLWNTKNRNFSGNVSARYENSGNRQPVTATGEINFHPEYKIMMSLRGSTLYRLPTLNDLYWMPGGNPDLLPEKGFSVDGGILLRPGLFLNKMAKGYELEGRIFYRNIRDWIQWTPGSSYWSPQNIDHVQSYGGESTMSFIFEYRKCFLNLKINTLYAVSEPITGAQTGNQLIYSPMYSGNAQLEIRNKYLWFSYAHFYTGYRYTSSDNYQYLEPYFLAQTEAGCNIKIKNTLFSISAGVRNMFNTNYQSMANRPM
ncbi:MAG: TonB-dependent receptor plug domain-containing protein, partial [Flavobacteriales bacterium]